MTQKLLGRTRCVHFVGIGGIGMSGIAEVLLNLGFQVTGSDRQLTSITERLESMGAKICEGHDNPLVDGADVVVISSAVNQQNPEVKRALDLKIPVIRRAEMLGELMRMKQGVAIAGTHGKTTTSSITGLVLQEGNYDPTLIIGGKVNHLNTNAKLGTGNYLVAEADEYDRSFLELTPTIAVITNIESDHLDCYKDLDDIKETFVKFANKVPFYGAVVLCLDEESLQKIMPMLKRRIITYGINPQADVRALNIRYELFTSRYVAQWQGQELGEIHLKLPGLHNVKNSMAALAVGLELEIPFEKIKKALESFRGVHRRFEIKSEEKGRLVVDDYAHHPTEIEASLKGAREVWPGRIVAVFQPHLYSRTRDFYQDFGQSFFNADMLVVTDIYPAREEPIEGVSGALISDTAKALGHKHVEFVRDKKEIPRYLLENSREGDLIITMGAGDIYQYGEMYIELLKES